jgi:hypothetical protein
VGAATPLEPRPARPKFAVPGHAASTVPPARRLFGDQAYPMLDRQSAPWREAERKLVVFDEFDRLANMEARGLMSDTIKSLSDYGSSATVLVIGVADSVSDLIQEHQSIERVLMQIP